MTSIGRTKTEQAYSALRRAIVTGDLVEDMPLDDAMLLARFGFGRTPIREALKRLADEQFINYPPHRTPYVRGIKVRDLSRLYEARHLLEEPVARLAARRATPAQLDELQRICDRIDEEIAADRPYEAVEYDHQFHLEIARSTDNPFLAEAVNRLNCGSLRIWYLAHSTLGMANTNADHRAIQAALTDKDPEQAAAQVTRHIDKSYARQMELHRLDLVLLAPSSTPSPQGEAPP
ncbi:GntR family transcriptional regulator [Nonomuraea turcica]|uniref:GntR family transcriptional regulator n=1 Tax=Nonomuraea sp. G32 TaxID=3067274 RepID=UPI00273B1441|nr:GntR family transcriptional regulator [Nonomuraea sp. G32]MDP4506747.1 GntR family transcriptional regulator [Nonomuraea sp. G32]